MRDIHLNGLLHWRSVQICSFILLFIPFLTSLDLIRIALTGRSTLTSVPSNKETRQVMMDVESPAAGMCVVARWASRSRVFSACLRMDRRPNVLRRKLSMLGVRECHTTPPVSHKSVYNIGCDDEKYMKWCIMCKVTEVYIDGQLFMYKFYWKYNG